MLKLSDIKGIGVLLFFSCFSCPWTGVGKLLGASGYGRASIRPHTHARMYNTTSLSTAPADWAGLGFPRRLALRRWPLLRAHVFRAWARPCRRARLHACACVNKCGSSNWPPRHARVTRLAAVLVFYYETNTLGSSLEPFTHMYKTLRITYQPL